jgi:hypothetical protein
MLDLRQTGGGISPANRGNPLKNAISRPEADRFHRKNTIVVNYLENGFGVSAVQPNSGIE